jgi:hypothetical protein
MNMVSVLLQALLTEKFFSWIINLISEHGLSLNNFWHTIVA